MIAFDQLPRGLRGLINDQDQEVGGSGGGGMCVCGGVTAVSLHFNILVQVTPRE